MNKLNFKNDADSSLFLKLVFFAQEIPGVQVALERNGFRLSNAHYHTHVDILEDRGVENPLNEIKQFILSSVEDMENSFEVETHENLRKKNISSADYMSAPLKDGVNGRVLWGKAQLDAFYQKVEEVKKIK